MKFNFKKKKVNSVIPIGNKALSRRNFLTKGSIAIAGASTLVLGIGGAVVPAPAWASSAIGMHTSSTLLTMSRDIYPHDDLEDKYYTRLLTPIGEQAKKDESLKSLLINGVEELDRLSFEKFNKKYIDLKKEEDRVSILRDYENSAFFQKIKGTMMMGLYNSPDLWPWFGYGGSSWEQGGYINRGYQDIDWI
ncbi:Twin-arginine translocation pathway signal [Grimontia sp. AD028]|uniref:twin-arginine translocation pathway signal n=1 Tax=Grimontia sp. AD028 TaxID=1581149 RepID=UPI00061B0BB6|nr:twin-arginine translocation pathway signal [Grimontia sp. AD028]KKD59853.1 Twin-arginine translocation pathway signal [Grimontia sp. AD028]